MAANGLSKGFRYDSSELHNCTIGFCGSFFIVCSLQRSIKSSAKKMVIKFLQQTGIFLPRFECFLVLPNARRQDAQ